MNSTRNSVYFVRDRNYLAIDYRTIGPIATLEKAHELIIKLYLYCFFLPLLLVFTAPN